MKRLLLFFVLLCAGLLASTTLEAQDFPKLDKSPMDLAYHPSKATFRAFEKSTEAKQANEPVMRVLYSRPMKNDRDIFGSLVKYGEMWRMGANESTEILFLTDVKISGKTVKAGRYSMHAMVNEKNWEVFFNTDLDGWGSYAYDANNNVASITVAVRETKKTVEALSMFFEEKKGGANLVVGWEDTMVIIPIDFLN